MNSPWLRRWYDRQNAKARPGLLWWGRLVARQQLPVLLGCALVVCLVLSPAVSSFVTTAARLDTWNDVGRMLARPLDAAVALNSPVKLPWQGTEEVVAYEGEPCWSRLPRTRTLALQQVWMTTDDHLRGRGSEHGVLDRAALHRALRVEQELATTEASSRSVAGHVISPLAFWNSSEANLLADLAPLETLGNGHTRWTPSSLPYSIDTALIGYKARHSAAHSANLLALATFEEADSISSFRPTLSKHGSFAAYASQERHIVLRVRPSSSLRRRSDDGYSPDIPPHNLGKTAASTSLSPSSTSSSVYTSICAYERSIAFTREPVSSSLVSSKRPSRDSSVYASALPSVYDSNSCPGRCFPSSSSS